MLHYYILKLELKIGFYHLIYTCIKIKNKFMKYLKKYEIYSGPGKTPGFKYSNPDQTYLITSDMLLMPETNVEEVEEKIDELFGEYNIDVDWWNLTLYNKDPLEFEPDEESKDLTIYTLRIQTTAYSRFEIGSLIETFSNSLMEAFPEIEMKETLITVGGADADIEPWQKVKGFVGDEGAPRTDFEDSETETPPKPWKHIKGFVGDEPISDVDDETESTEKPRKHVKGFGKSDSI